MTEAQKCLYHIAENMRMDKSISKEGYEYFQQAIKALEQEPCEDCVNRQAVLNTLFYKSDNNCEVVLNKELQDRIKALPSVTPQPFINKPCVSEGVCREDKIQVLDKIRTEIKSMSGDVETLSDVLDVIDKYGAESEDKE